MEGEEAEDDQSRADRLGRVEECESEKAGGRGKPVTESRGSNGERQRGRGEKDAARNKRKGKGRGTRRRPREVKGGEASMRTSDGKKRRRGLRGMQRGEEGGKGMRRGE